MNLSCGIVLLDQFNQVLVARVTGTDSWTLPKGHLDAGETPAQAAVRETWEEMGIRVQQADLHDLGRFPYRKTKDLYLFATRVENAGVDLGACRCSTYFEDAGEGPRPEVDAYQWVALDNIDKFCNDKQAALLTQLQLPALTPQLKLSHVSQ